MNLTSKVWNRQPSTFSSRSLTALLRRLGRTTGESMLSRNLRRTFIAEYVTKLTSRSNVSTAVNTVVSRVIRLRTAGNNIQKRHPVILPRGRILRVRQKFLQRRREIEDLHQWAPIEVVNTNRATSLKHPTEEDGREIAHRGSEHFLQRLPSWGGMVWILQDLPL